MKKLRQQTIEFDPDKRLRRELLRTITISPEDAAVYRVSQRTVTQVLLALEDHYSRQNCVWPSEATLAEITCLGLRTVQRAVKWIRERQQDAVDIERPRFGRASSNRYSFMWGTIAERIHHPQPLYPQRGEGGFQPATSDIPTRHWEQSNPPLATFQTATSGARITTEPPIEQPIEPPRQRGSKEIGLGGSEGGPETTDPIEVRRITFSIQAACGAWKERLSRQDRDLIAGMAEDFTAGRISRDQILEALRETDSQIRRAAERGSPINQPVSYLSRVLGRMADAELAR